MTELTNLTWADLVALLNQLLAYLSGHLAGLGVPEQYLPLVALGVVYLGVTLLVLLFILLLLRLFRRPPKTGRAPDEQAIRKPAERSESVVEPVSEGAGEEPAEELPASQIPVADEEESQVDALDTAVPELEQQDVSEATAGQLPDIDEEAIPEPEPDTPRSLFERLRTGLAKTQSSLVGRVDGLLRGRSAIDDELIEELEEILITADLGMPTTQRVIQSLEKSRARGALSSPDQVRQLLQEELAGILGLDAEPLDTDSAAPFVIMVVGVNGVGKTTTIGKLAHQFTRAGKKVVLGAGDTFRAAAAEQLQIWGERAGVEVVRHNSGADPGAVAFDAAKAAVARQADILLLDTAGRLQTKVNLMEELKKVRRVLDREIPGAPHETLLVLDATTGQNALSQAQLFHAAVPLTGLALTKLDGTAKGGIVVAICAELQVPVRYVGIGEKLDDLRPFEASQFVAALFERD